MDWKEIGSKLANAAPVLGTLLGGPAGAAVGSLIASTLGTSNDPAAVSAALMASPDAYVKLQELQTNAKVQLQQLQVQAEQNRMSAEAAQFAAEAGDRDSARKLAASQPTDFIRPTITILLIGGAFAILIGVFGGFGGFTKDLIKDPTAALTLGTVTGFWFNELKQTLGFYFGMTKEGAAQNRSITSFAVTPGTVTSDTTTTTK